MRERVFLISDPSCFFRNEPFFTWMSTLGAVYLPLVDPMSQSDLEHNVNQVRMSIDLCYDHLPPLLNVEEDKTSLFLEPLVFSFPYHPPSRFSSTISSVSPPNESMSHVLQQVNTPHFLIITLNSAYNDYVYNDIPVIA